MINLASATATIKVGAAPGNTQRLRESEVIAMTDANGKDEFGRDIHLRESYHTRQALLRAERNAENAEQERSEAGGGCQSAVVSNQGSRPVSTSRSSSRVSRRSSGGRDSEGLVGLRLDGEHGVAGTKRCSQSRMGDQPLDWRSRKDPLRSVYHP